MANGMMMAAAATIAAKGGAGYECITYVHMWTALAVGFVWGMSFMLILFYIQIMRGAFKDDKYNGRKQT